MQKETHQTEQETAPELIEQPKSEAQKKPKKKIKKTKKAAKESDDEDVDVPATAPETDGITGTGPKLEPENIRLLARLGFEGVTDKEAVFYAASLAALLLLLVATIVLVVSVVRRIKKQKKITEDKEMATQAGMGIRPNTLLPSYDEVEQQAQSFRSPTTEKGAVSHAADMKQSRE